MRTNWISGGAILIILAVLFILLPVTFEFFWITPTVFFTLGLIILIIGLILPEQTREKIIVDHNHYYHD
jgi:membrane-bound ClpP family serine protease